MWTLYVLRCVDGSLYCGITNRLHHRLDAHSAGKGAKYTRSRGPLELVYVEEHLNRPSAARAEYAFKQIPKGLKEMTVAKERTEYQKGVIKRYYEHKDDINAQKLGELVSELYLATSEVNKKRLWKSAGPALLGLVEGDPKLKVRAEKIIADKSVEELAKILGEIF